MHEKEKSREQGWQFQWKCIPKIKDKTKNPIDVQSYAKKCLNTTDIFRQVYKGVYFQFLFSYFFQIFSPPHPHSLTNSRCLIVLEIVSPKCKVIKFTSRKSLSQRSAFSKHVRTGFRLVIWVASLTKLYLIFLYCNRNLHSKFQIDKTFLFTKINNQSYLSQTLLCTYRLLMYLGKIK